MEGIAPSASPFAAPFALAAIRFALASGSGFAARTADIALWPGAFGRARLWGGFDGGDGGEAVAVSGEDGGETLRLKRRVGGEVLRILRVSSITLLSPDVMAPAATARSCS